MAPYLDRAGYVVELATTGLEALVRMRRRLADLVVVDLELPLMSGAELIAAARRDRRARLRAVCPAVGREQLAEHCLNPWRPRGPGQTGRSECVLLAVVNRASRS